MAQRTSSQNLQLHGILKKMGLPSDLWADEKKALALQFSSNRTEKTSDLSYNEMNDLLRSLNTAIGKQKPTSNEVKPGDNQRKKIYAIMRALNWTENNKLDYGRLTEWLLTHTALAKPHLRNYDGKDLNDVVSAFEKMEVQKTKSKK